MANADSRKGREPVFMVKPSDGPLTDEDIDALADEMVAAFPDDAFKQGEAED